MVGPRGEVLQNLPLARVVLSASELALLVDGLSLLGDAFFVKQSLDKEVCESLHTFNELPTRHLEVIVGLLV